jgi:hypothetical protein
MSTNKMAEVPSLSPVTWQAGVPMDKAYLFQDGMDEFTPPPGTKLKQFRLHVRAFLSSPARAVSEFPLPVKKGLEPIKWLRTINALKKFDVHEKIAICRIQPKVV